MKINKLCNTLFCVAVIAASCSKPDCPCDSNENQSAVLSLNIDSETTKSTVVQSSAEENKINSVDIFIFRNTSPTSEDYQKLDTYKRVISPQNGSIKVSTTTGPKTICVLINDHGSNFTGVTTLEKFRKIVTKLQSEKLSDFTMYGEANATLGTESSVAITVQRFISKIELKSVSTKFSGTPYSGMSLTNCKLFLVNAHGDKIVYNNTPTTNPTIMNYKKLVGEDVNGCAEEELLAEILSVGITDVPITTSHCFYTYSNITDNIEESTKLVLQGDLDGVTYYYPIPINQKGYGLDDSGTDGGVGRNTHYSYGIVVTRPGSLDPNIPLVPGTLELSLSVTDWVVVPTFEKTF